MKRGLRIFAVNAGGLIFSFTQKDPTMKPFGNALLFLATFFFMGCPARSIHPLFTEQNAVLLASLVGTWENNDETYTFESFQGNNYRLVVRPKSENDSAVFLVLSGKIGTHWFLDSYPIVNSSEHHFLSTHIFTKMSLNDDSLSLSTLEADWLLKMSNAKKLKVPHVKRENEIILTGTTGELRQWIATAGANPEAFPEMSTFHRVQ
jgi:hypothetical protein